MSVEKSVEEWGGIIETVYNDCSECNEVPENIRILKEKLARLGDSKNLKEIQHSLHFTIEERNYLNSPLLDEIFDTIFFSNKLVSSCCELGKFRALKFYTKRLKFENTTYGKGLLEAVKNNHVDIVKYLLKFRIPHDSLSSSLESACENGSMDILKLLAKKIDVFYCGDGFTFACRMRHVEIVEFLLDNYYYNDAIEHGFPEAVKSGSKEIVMLLMRFGAGNKSLKDAFVSACENGNKEIIDILLGKFPGFNDVDERLVKLAEKDRERVAGLTEEERMLEIAEGNLTHKFINYVNFCKTRTKPSNSIIQYGMYACQEDGRDTLYEYLKKELRSD